jgi:predicted XRE-type DNA-binding protein
MNTPLTALPSVLLSRQPRLGISAFPQMVGQRALTALPCPVVDTEADKRVIKEALMDGLAQWMQRNQLKQVEAAHILGVAPSRVSDAINKKTPKFTVDALIDLLTKTGQHVHLSFR